MTDALSPEVMKLAREAYYGKHERGWVRTPLIGEVDTAPVLRIARALTADRASCQARIEELERAACLVCSFTWTSKDANAIAAMQALSSVALPARSPLEGK